MFKVEYLWNGSVKKDGVKANNFKYPINFAFSPRLTDLDFGGKQLKNKFFSARLAFIRFLLMELTHNTNCVWY